MKYIPRRTKVKMEFIKGITIGDVIVALIGIIVLALILISSGIGTVLTKVYISAVWVALIVCLLVRVSDGQALYTTLLLLIKFFAYRKHYSKKQKPKTIPVSTLVPYVNIRDGFIDFENYYGAVIEIRPIEFWLLNEEKQEAVIRTVADSLKLISQTQSVSIVKTAMPMAMDQYIYAEDRKYDEVLERVSDGEMSKEEAEARSFIFESRLAKLRDFQNYNKIYKEHFFIVVYDNDRESLSITTEGMIGSLRRGMVPLYSERLRDTELAVFLRSNYGQEFNQEELALIPMKEYTKWTMPSTVDFRAGRTVIDGREFRNFSITDYPLNVANAWAFPFFSLTNSKAIMNLRPIPNDKAERQLDRAIAELEGRLSGIFKSSKKVEVETQLRTLRDLISDIKIGNEYLFNVNFHIVASESVKKEVRGFLKQYGFRYSELFGRQVEAFVSANISRIDKDIQFERAIQTSSIAAGFPFISNTMQDPGGFFLGWNNYPVFIDFFQRNNERVNSNMIIIGKSGSGKSYATKVLLSNLAADNARIFIVDPEDEYTILSKNLHGKTIDVGSSAQGILNPFHVMTSLEADEGGSGDSFLQYLQFLEEFFRIIFEGMSPDAFEVLNMLVNEVYKRKGITPKTDLSKLTPTDYPIFDDLYNLVNERIEKEKDEYHHRNLQIIQNYVQKFASGGRNSNLWNGPTSIETKENFICFSFRSLLVNRNQTIANAQMLLVFKYLDNEILKNRDFNLKYETLRKVVFVVDEAHLFINPKFPIALDFMTQMAKRIRKYEGMQIIITQNIKDFIGGSEETKRQASAVINASQYSMIFSLAPNDMTDLVDLYRNAGEINKDEQDAIVSAGRGQCFFISSAYSRTRFTIEANDMIKKLAGLADR